jgi:hypothetical protein
MAALEPRIRSVGSDGMSTPLGAASPTLDTAICQCGHAEVEHDAIARRYCAATWSAELTRGCICREMSCGPCQ